MLQHHLDHMFTMEFGSRFNIFNSTIYFENFEIKNLSTTPRFEPSTTLLQYVDTLDSVDRGSLQKKIIINEPQVHKRLTGAKKTISSSM